MADVIAPQELEDKALFVQRLTEALIECGAGRYDWLREHPLVYEASDGGEHVWCRGLEYRRANVRADSLPAMMGDIHSQGLL